MEQIELIEEFSNFKQELQLNLRSQHDLISDGDCFDEDIIMGLLHQERRISNELVK